MLDTDGRLIEGTMSNIFLVNDTDLLTPALEGCGVQGIIRQQIMESVAENLKLSVTVKDLQLGDLYAADEAFICNSLIEVWPIIALDDHKKSPGPITNAVQIELREQAVAQT